MKTLRTMIGRLRRSCIFRQAMRRFTALAPGAPAPEGLLQNLIEGWGNPFWSGRAAFLRACLRHAWAAKGPILECGSGLSTVLLGVVTKGAGTRVWSLEHDPYWAAVGRSTLRRYGIGSVELRLAPLRDYGEFAWYDPPSVGMPLEFALVVCDGPPGDTKGGRRGLMPIMARRLGRGCVILLDDVDRRDERAILGSWADEFGVPFEVWPNGTGRSFGKLVLSHSRDDV